MPTKLRATIAAVGLLAGPVLLLAGTAAGASTVVMMPSPTSMEGPRVFVGAGNPDDIYVCTSPTEPGGGRCSLHHAHPRSSRR